MGPVAHHPLDQDGGIGADPGCLPDQVRRHRVGIALVRLGHVLVDGDMAAALRAAGMAGDALVIMEELDHPVGEPHMVANERRRFGYRRLFILLRREGEASEINRIYRLCREEGLTVRKRRARRRGTRTPILVEAKPNARWSLDFVMTSSPAAGASAC